MQRRKKIGLWVAGALLTPVVLFFLLVGLLYLPPVQQWAVQEVCTYASEQTGMDIRLKRLRIRFPLDIDLQELSATTPPDTILAVRHAVVDLDFSHIWSGHLAVDGIDLCNGSLDTRDLISTVIVKGKLGTLHLKADEIGLWKQAVELTSACLKDCDVDIALRDTSVTDTTTSAPIGWRLRLGDIQVRHTRVAFHTIGDSLCVRSGIQCLMVQGGEVNLLHGVYKVDHLFLKADSLCYDTYQRPVAEGTDYNHLSVSPIQLEAEQLYYRQKGNILNLHLKRFSGRDRSGLEVSSLAGHIRLDETHIQLPDLVLVTPHSSIEGQINLDWSALTPQKRGNMDVAVTANIGKTDVLLLAGTYLPADVHSMLPSDPISLSAQAHGNVDSLHIDEAHLMLSPMFEAQLQGALTNLLAPSDLGGDLSLEAQTFDLSILRQAIGLPSSVRLPRSRLSGTANLHNAVAQADLRLFQGKGNAHMKGTYNTATETYWVQADVHNLNLHNFLPNDSIYTLTAHATAEGRGTDLRSPRARAKADLRIEHLQYAQHDIDDVHLTAQVRDGNGLINFYSDNNILQADACAELQLNHKITFADFSLGLSHIDLHALGITDKPLSISMVMQADGNTNFSNTHQLQGHIKAMQLDVAEGTFYPADIDLSLLLSPDTIHAAVLSGDLNLQVLSSHGWEQVMDKGQRFYAEAQRQFGLHHIDQDTLMSLLPRLTIHLESGRQNTLAKIVETMGYTYEQMLLTLDSAPETGLNGRGYVHELNTGAIMLDTIQWDIHEDSTNVLSLDARIKNGPRNRQVVFDSHLSAHLTPHGADANVIFLDAKGRKGMDVGAQLTLEEDGYRVHLHPLNPIIAYRHFTINADNYIYLHDNKRVEALVDLLADDGTGFKLYSTPNEDALQDITLSAYDFNLGELSSVIPYMPQVGGVLAGDLHLVQDEQSVSVLVDANVQGMDYEGAQLGNVGLNAVYLPNPDGTHYVDGIVSQNGTEVMTLAGTYSPEGEGTIDAKGTLMRLPLDLANGFIPERTIALAGYVTGEMAVTGSVAKPVLNGALATDSMYLNSDMYSLHLRFPDDTIGIRNSHLDFNRIEAYSTGRNPLVLDGSVNFRDLSRIVLDLSLSAHNFELINAPKSQKAVAYGKVYVDLTARLTGALNDMLLRGKLDVLGNTDVTYVLTDSPLTVEDQLAELVTFVDFADTTSVEVEKSAPQNIDMTMNLNIQQAAQVHCLLSTDGTNYIDLEGGGDLTLSYTTQDGLRLYGRYTIVSGLMNYSLMVMALKNFAIQSGSYAEFTGDITNPRLSISASERVKTTVYEDNVPQSVSFDVGLSVSQTLENMGLEFTLEAPGNMTISNQLATMSSEERGKVAVTMLATGMYLTESGNGTSGFSATNALNSFLQTQIAAISNKALSTIDLNFGIDNTNTASGGTQTDYNFSFAKRFWGNRISLIIGGKVSSGSEAQNTGQSIINNISLEYRLDKSATRYVRVYYDRNTESLLEGEVTEMGAGIVFRRKSTRLGELFLFRKKNQPDPPLKGGN